jgi:ATP-dependent DNA helicase DinG
VPEELTDIAHEFSKILHQTSHLLQSKSLEDSSGKFGSYAEFSSFRSSCYKADSYIKKLIDQIEGAVPRGEFSALRLSCLIFSGSETSTGEEVSLNSIPLEIGSELQCSLGVMNLFAISATLTYNRSFDAIANALGFADSDTPFSSFDAGTVFDYRRQGILYVPRDGEMPEPTPENRDRHFEEFLRRAEDLILCANGGALVLLATKRECKLVGEYLASALPDSIRVFAAGEHQNKSKLIYDFEQDDRSVLVGTRGFFQGIDIPGASLRLVIVNKIPFLPPSLLDSKRMEFLKSKNMNGFDMVCVAPTANLLAQAAGRLIRHSGDKGVVAVFDTRLNTKRYGKSIVNTMPPFHRVYNYEVVRNACCRISPRLPL